MSEHHIVSPKVYFTIFSVLMICTVLTVFAAEVDLNKYFPGLNIIVALTCRLSSSERHMRAVKTIRAHC